nr:200 kDa antigen p200 [Tanacetum cinerariifolium]
RPKSNKKKQLPRSECKKKFPLRRNCQVWIASNEKYLQSKIEKESQWKRKRKEKKSPGRWTRSDETKLLAEKHKRIKKQQADYQQTTKNEDKGKEEVVDVEQESEKNERLKKQKQAETEKKKNQEQRKREECPMGDIVITPKTVKEVLGFSMGTRKLEEKDKERSYENNSSLKFTLLRNVFEGDDVSDIDWCSYILECASVSKVNWSKTKKKIDVVYYGPVMFLMLTYLHNTKFDTLKVKRRVPAFKSWNTRLLKKREMSELQNYYMGIAEILDDVEKINENLIKFQNDERLIQLRERMKVIFKEPNITEYHSSSSTESDDDDYDNSQAGDDNEKSCGTQTDSVEEDHVQIVTIAQQEEGNNLQYIDEENDEKGVSQSEDELMKDENTECCEKKMKRNGDFQKR